MWSFYPSFLSLFCHIDMYIPMEYVSAITVSVHNRLNNPIRGTFRILIQPIPFCIWPANHQVSASKAKFDAILSILSPYSSISAI